MIVVPPKNEKTDMIFLVNTFDQDVYKMTKAAIDSLRESESENSFRVILVESNHNNPPCYDVDLSLSYVGDFNYNRALNMAFDWVHSDYVAVFNNDVFFQDNWYTNLRYNMDLFELDCASPWCPVNQQGPSPQAQALLNSYQPSTVVVGHEAMIHIAGWGWLIKRDVLNNLRPFPEDLSFWFSDNYMGHQLRRLGYKAGCVRDSHVIHFGQQSYKHIDPSKIHGMTMGLQSKYQELIRKK